MVDDLVLQGVTEPYRMLTARAEHRLRLRADNASTRLTPVALAAGCVGEERRRWFEAQQGELDRLRALLAREAPAAALIAAGASVKQDGVRRSLFGWLRFPIVTGDVLLAIEPALAAADPVLIAELVEDGRYAPYLARQDAEIEAARSSEAIMIGEGLCYRSIPGLSAEMIERFEAARPRTLGEAQRIRGVTPAALAAVLVHTKRKAA